MNVNKKTGREISIKFSLWRARKIGLGMSYSQGSSQTFGREGARRGQYKIFL